MHRLTDGGGTGTYTEAQLRERLLASQATIGCRYEVLDQRLNPIGDGDRCHLSTVTAASIDVDGARLIPGALKLSMLPDPLLPLERLGPFARYIRPWWRLRMLDGGWAEWPMGVYVWTRPKIKRVGNGVQHWEAVLGDLSTVLSMTGPDLDGFQVPSQANVTAAIIDIYQRALGYTVDVAGIMQSAAIAPGTLSWSNADSSGTSGKTPTGASRLLGVPATSWQQILKTLQQGVGYQPPRFGWLGAPIARPFAVNLWAEPAAFTFTVDQDSILDPGTDETPMLDTFANRVQAIANNASANAYQGNAVADANDYLPGHLWSQARCGHYVTTVIPNAGASDARTLLASAIGELFVRMASVSEASIETQMWPVIEPWDILGVDLDGYTTIPRFLATAFSVNLMTGRMKFKLPQITGIVDNTEPETVVEVSSPPPTGDLVLVDSGGDMVLVDSGGDMVLVS